MEKQMEKPFGTESIIKGWGGIIDGVGDFGPGSIGAGGSDECSGSPNFGIPPFTGVPIF